MRLLDGQLVLSPSDLAKYTRCAHATTLDLGRIRGTLKALAGPQRSLHTDFIVRKGTEHEESYIERLARAGNQLIHIRGERKTAEDIRNAASDTLDAMRSGADYIYQAVFFDGAWVGYADLLEKVRVPSDLGDWSYEVIDTKLARTTKPHFILQLSVYSEHLGRVQGHAPAKMHVILGNEERSTFRVADFDAYYRHIKERFVNRVAPPTPAAQTLPYIIDFCSLCEWRLHCWRHLEQLDHPVRIANIRREQIRRLETVRVTTLTQIAETPMVTVAKLRPDAYAALHQQARLQSEQMRTKQHRYELLQPEVERGFELLPQPSPGDVFLDVEGDPYAGTGITYLFGLAWEPEQYKAYWAHDALQEKRSFEQVIDFIVARRAADPSMHIYHYGALDASTLKRMAGEYATREDEIDDFLRSGVFVDLFTVVRQAMRVSQPSYGLKKVEAFYFQREEEGVFEKGGPILAYEEWLEKQDDELLVVIENYNREDCVSTIQLRKWLLQLRAEAEQQYGVTIPWRPIQIADRTEDAIDAAMRDDALSAALLATVPEDLIGITDQQKARWLLAHLVHYYRREDRPAWWFYFERLKMSPEELLEDSESIAGLELATDIATYTVKRSTVYTFRFPPQEHKVAPGDHPINPATKKRAGTIDRIDDATLELRRGIASTEPLPTALIPEGPIETTALRDAVRRFATSYSVAAAPYRAARDILERRIPRIRGIVPGQPLHGEHVVAHVVQQLVESLDNSYLFIQGPPGAGKTYQGARAIVELLRNNKRVGVASNSHKAIHNLLDEVEKVAREENVSFTGRKKCSGDNPESKYDRGNITSSDEIAGFTDPAVNLVAGTAWLFAHASMDQTLDYVFIDEAGQVSIANALAIATAARNIVLLGDPLQLAQVSQATHPGNSGASVLQHLLGSDATIPRDRGVFLEQTWRMHPNVCRFVSEVVYDGRLESAKECANQSVSGMTGLRYIPIDHEGNSTSSAEEATRIADEIEMFLNFSFTSSRNETRSLTQKDVLVVAPYNAQVRKITETLRERGLGDVPVGTVDKFQGREAAIVFFSMTTSSGDDLPRDIDFLFSRNRLNVAVSRARCIAVLVASPRLLDVACHTPEQMQLVNALCRFIEMATPAHTVP